MAQLNKQQLDQLRSQVLGASNIGSLNMGTMPQAQTTQKPKGNSLLKALLSIGGGAAGGVIGTFLAPGVGTAIGAGLGSGLGTGIGRAAGGESVLGDGGVGEIALDTALGGAFSGFGKVGKLAKAGQEITETAGKTAIKGVSEAAAASAAKKAPQEIFGKIGQAGIRAGEKELGLQEGAKLSGRYLKPANADELYKFGREEIGLVGSELTSPGLAVRKVNDYKTALLKPLEDSLQASNKIFDTKDYNAILKQARSTYGLGVDPTSKAVKSLEANVRNSIVKGGIPELNKTRQGLDEIINYARKEGSVDPVREQVASALRRAVDDRLTQLVPNSKAIRGAMGKAYQLEELAYQAATKEARPISGAIDLVQRIGRNTAARAGGNTRLQGALGTLSNANLVGGRLAGSGTSALGQLGRQSLREGVTTGMMGGGQPVDPMADPTAGPMTEGLSTDMAGMDQMNSMDNPVENDTSLLRMQLEDAMLQDLQQTGGKRIPALKSVLETLAPDAPKPSAAATKADAQTSTVINRLGQLEELFGAAGGGRGRVGGLIGGAAGAIGADEGAYNYNQFRDSLLAPLARAISGEVGVLTDRDIKRADGLLPKLTDSPQEANRRIQLLLQAVQDQRTTNQRVYSSGGGQSRLSDVMYNMEGLQ